MLIHFVTPNVYDCNFIEMYYLAYNLQNINIISRITELIFINSQYFLFLKLLQIECTNSIQFEAIFLEDEYVESYLESTLFWTQINCRAKIKDGLHAEQFFFKKWYSMFHKNPSNLYDLIYNHNSFIWTFPNSLFSNNHISKVSIIIKFLTSALHCFMHAIENISLWIIVACS